MTHGRAALTAIVLTGVVAATGLGSLSPAAHADDPVAPNPPTVTKVEVVAAQSIKVTVTAPVEAGTAPIEAYRFTCRPAGDELGTFGIATSANTSLVLRGLTTGVDYECLAQAISADGTSAWSEASLPVLLATVPGRPTILSAKATGPRTARLALAKLGDSGSAVTSYAATCKPRRGTAVTTTSTSRTIVVKKLKPATSYTCRVRAINALGAGVQSLASKAFTTTKA